MRYGGILQQNNGPAGNGHMGRIWDGMDGTDGIGLISRAAWWCGMDFESLLIKACQGLSWLLTTGGVEI